MAKTSVAAQSLRGKPVDEQSAGDALLTDADLAVAGQISRAMVRFFRSAHRFKAQIALGQRIDQTGFVLLSVLADCGPLRSALLASRMHSDPSTISRQVAHLVQQGLIERTADPGDGRASLLAATEAGRANLAEAREHRTRLLAGVIGQWSDRDRRTLAILLDRLANDLAGNDAGTNPSLSTRTENT